MATGTASNPWRRIRTRKGLVPRAAIRRVVEKIVREFEPEKVYLFGSYAYGKPHRDSDVDLLVVMPTRNEKYQGAKIHYAADAPFPMDVIVRKPKDMETRLRQGDCLVREVVSQGIICHEKRNSGLAGKSGRRHSGRAKLDRGR